MPVGYKNKSRERPQSFPAFVLSLVDTRPIFLDSQLGAS